ncbi:hypothetical protein T492DRAFT_1128371, partial [Pavlovales sp. CCMP2436]
PPPFLVFHLHPFSAHLRSERESRALARHCALLLTARAKFAKQGAWRSLANSRAARRGHRARASAAMRAALAAAAARATSVSAAAEASGEARRGAKQHQARAPSAHLLLLLQRGSFVLGALRASAVRRRHARAHAALARPLLARVLRAAEATALRELRRPATRARACLRLALAELRLAMQRALGALAEAAAKAAAGRATRRMALARRAGRALRALAATAARRSAAQSASDALVWLRLRRVRHRTLHRARSASARFGLAAAANAAAGLGLRAPPAHADPQLPQLFTQRPPAGAAAIATSDVLGKLDAAATDLRAAVVATARGDTTRAARALRGWRARLARPPPSVVVLADLLARALLTDVHAALVAWRDGALARGGLHPGLPPPPPRLARARALVELAALRRWCAAAATARRSTVKRAIGVKAERAAALRALRAHALADGGSAVERARNFERGLYVARASAAHEAAARRRALAAWRAAARCRRKHATVVAAARRAAALVRSVGRIRALPRALPRGVHLAPMPRARGSGPGRFAVQRLDVAQA